MCLLVICCVTVLTYIESGPTLMAELSKALPLTASYLSPLPEFESRPGHFRKLTVTRGHAVVFARYYGFLHHIQLASHDCNIAEKVIKI